MHGLEQIKFINSDAEIKRRHEIARRLNHASKKKKSTAKKTKSKKDACYHKVKASYKVFPSAYASGAIAKCRKKGAGRKK